MLSEHMIRGIRERAQAIIDADIKATRGPWRLFDNGNVGNDFERQSVAVMTGSAAKQRVDDACFIAQTRNMAPELARDVIMALDDLGRQPSEPRGDIKGGDIVTIRSGGPKMTVSAVCVGGRGQIAVLSWMADGAMRSAECPVLCLDRVAP